MLVCGALYMQAQEANPSFEKEGDMVKATFYHDNGMVSQTGYFLDGKLHGEWIMYDRDGKKTASGQYDMGAKEGKWFFWKDDVLQEVDYIDNEIINVVNWSNSEPVAIN
jgi:antitoxin component YwqK of YwqJK toxin-antitoxin module